MKPILKKIESDSTETKEDEEDKPEIKPPEKKLQIIKPIKECTNFANVEEFNQFYEENKNLFEELTTCKLNKMFKIEGFRITKIKGQVSLKSIPESRVTNTMKIDELIQRIVTVEDRVNSIIEFINSRFHA
ncbi:hypothetical protein TVAG_201700 [Trichomonas vaginalis G3]|uniref:Uncharacterized protein n=1 Tax=Trichomonas vaginalis (strain ATCC PRA-98 / G3) TaxID=412133 RepID=A2DWJ1_TRIV3|nr:hypothetical protein TVAGG3_0202210 [Trichomonas vaginalis G3]EAY15176.1 hypothetical protein TVAG_201700 [Trichomonas vaginalis G3]KAI5550673.1 hypothetical protein TVAGG3_0202210 [Trichomonas vaginalis G3]|eukprot:XP_001327399.1 hypothetical protein [Trichomonas vaginalis G3]